MWSYLSFTRKLFSEVKKSKFCEGWNTDISKVVLNLRCVNDPFCVCAYKKLKMCLTKIVQIDHKGLPKKMYKIESKSIDTMISE